MKPCGTDAAYVRHKRHGEVPCAECKRAHYFYVRAWAKQHPTPIEHGTLSGYYKEIRRNLEPCQECIQAATEHGQACRLTNVPIVVTRAGMRKL